jgi:hypothetical protein
VPNFMDLTGQRFGRLTVVRRAPPPRTRWHCRCDCGGESISPTSTLRSGASQSCGCLQRERASASAKIKQVKHGATAGRKNSPEYYSWCAMKTRCLNRNVIEYQRYGGAGVTISDRWLNNFEAFLEDMGPRPGPDYSLDRYPNKFGNYGPDNCRWATRVEQQNNRRDIENGRKVRWPKGAA